MAFPGKGSDDAVEQAERGRKQDAIYCGFLCNFRNQFFPMNFDENKTEKEQSLYYEMSQMRHTGIQRVPQFTTFLFFLSVFRRC